MMKKLNHVPNRPVTMDVRVKTIRFPKENQIRTYGVFTGIDAYGQEVRISGFFPGLSAGESVRVNGTWQLYADPATGAETPEVKADGYTLLEFTGTDQIAAYLEGLGVPGCGPKTIRNIILEYGMNTIREITDSPDRFAERKIPGASRPVREGIRDAVTESYHTQNAYAFLIQAGFPDKTAALISDRYGKNTVSVYNSDPYLFSIDCPDITYAMIDDILTSNGKYDSVSSDRIASAIMHKLKIDESAGHVFSDGDEVKKYVSRQLGLTTQNSGNLRNAYRDAVGKLSLSHTAEIDGDGRLFLEKRKNTEKNVAKLLYAIHRSPCRNPYSSPGKLFSPGNGLSFEQKKAVWNVFENPLSIITGGPGTGKSYVTRMIYEAASAAGLSCMAAAPTGRAARRLDAAIFGLSDEEDWKRPKTLHRLLRADDREGGFRMNRENRLSYDLLIIDESSMIDIDLACSLLSAVRPDARLVFIGDAEQLPSVGPGNFFADMIASGCIPVTKLTEVFRQEAGGSIIMNSGRINSGRFPMCACRFGLRNDDFFFFECGPGSIASCLLDCVTRALPGHFGLDPVRDIQVLLPVRSGAFGTVRINEILREKLNPRKPGTEDYAVGSCVFRPGDKVMQTANNYEMMVFNGDIGYISDISGGVISVYYPDYDRIVSYSRREAVSLVPAYAVTVHKSQGSETGAAVIILESSNAANAVRKQLYTAVTRARRAVVLIGDRSAFQSAISDVRAVSRNTQLCGLLKAEFTV